MFLPCRAGSQAIKPSHSLFVHQEATKKVTILIKPACIRNTISLSGPEDATDSFSGNDPSVDQNNSHQERNPDRRDGTRYKPYDAAHDISSELLGLLHNSPKLCRFKPETAA